MKFDRNIINKKFIDIYINFKQFITNKIGDKYIKLFDQLESINSGLTYEQTYINVFNEFIKLIKSDKNISNKIDNQDVLFFVNFDINTLPKTAEMLGIPQSLKLWQDFPNTQQYNNVKKELFKYIKVIKCLPDMIS